MDQMTARCGGDGGAIAIDTKGRIAIEWNSLRMGWAYTILDNTLLVFDRKLSLERTNE